MVRELDPHAEGLLIEIYCFSTNKNWVPYEHLQADIIDHLLAIYRFLHCVLTNMYRAINGSSAIKASEPVTEKATD